MEQEFIFEISKERKKLYLYNDKIRDCDLAKETENKRDIYSDPS